MTNLIYRGVAHTRSKTAPVERRARDLIYRGIRHDGLSERPTIRNTKAVLIYRGVFHGATDRAGSSAVFDAAAPLARHPRAIGA